MAGEAEAFAQAEAAVPLLENAVSLPADDTGCSSDPVVLPRDRSTCVLAAGAGKIQGAAYKATQRKLLIALTIAFLFMIVEVVGGVYAHSLAIITDAAHLLSDVSGFGVSALAAVWAARVSHSHFSYGYHRVEVLGALASILTVWLVTGILLVEAIQRIITPEPVDGKIMFVLALTGVAVNVGLLFVLGVHHGHDHGSGGDHDHGHGHSPGPCGGHAHAHEEEAHDHDHEHEHDHDHDHEHEHDHDHEHEHEHEHEHGHDVEHGCVKSRDGNGSAPKGKATAVGKAHNINMVGAVVHVIGDLVQSIGVAIAGLLIWIHQDDPRWAIADPICTFLFAALVLWTTKRVLRDIADVLMERAPRGLDIADIEDDMLEIPGVSEVSDLHVWSLTPGIPLLCAHVKTTQEVPAAQVLAAVTAYVRRLGIKHSTLQLAGTAAAF